MTEDLEIPYIKGVTFGFMTPKGSYADEAAKESMKQLALNTGADTIILALAALQKTAHSEDVDYIGAHMPSDAEVIEMIDFAKTLGVRVILKPMVNCVDGTWRAHINFFDKEVSCEPKWSKWFESYTVFQLHYARIAEKLGCEMVIVGCEMVQTERKADEWRNLIREVRKVYHGLISYNTDKYQEEMVSWWDAVDVISSSGYYPINAFDKELKRIYQAILPFNKPFFFAEAGCMSTAGSSLIPNNWDLQGTINLEEQKEYYEKMFQHAKEHTWIKGFGIWDWSSHLYPKEMASKDSKYEVYGKPACEVIRKFYTSMR